MRSAGWQKLLSAVAAVRGTLQMQQSAGGQVQWSQRLHRWHGGGHLWPRHLSLLAQQQVIPAAGEGCDAIDYAGGLWPYAQRAADALNLPFLSHHHFKRSAVVLQAFSRCA